jgi:hypothetical protein
MKVVVGLFTHTEDAERAVNEMVARGYDPAQIGVLARDQPVQEHMQQVRDEGGPTEAQDQAIPRQVATGAAGGTAIGGIAGLIGGIAAVVIPGIGPVVGAGTIIGATLLGAGLGAGAGAAASGLLKLGVPEQSTQTYTEGVKRGNVLLSIRVIDGLAGEVESIFQQNMAQDIMTNRVEEEHLPESEIQGGDRLGDIP